MGFFHFHRFYAEAARLKSPHTFSWNWYYQAAGELSWLCIGITLKLCACWILKPGDRPRATAMSSEAEFLGEYDIWSLVYEPKSQLLRMNQRMACSGNEESEDSVSFTPTVYQGRGTWLPCLWCHRAGAKLLVSYPRGVLDPSCVEAWTQPTHLCPKRMLPAKSK